MLFCVSGVPPETDPGQMIDKQRRIDFGKGSRNTKSNNIMSCFFFYKKSDNLILQNYNYYNLKI